MLESFSTNQWIILLLVLALGWLLGLLSASRGGKWRREYHAERERRLALEHDRELRVAEAESRRHAHDMHDRAPDGHVLNPDGHRGAPTV